MMRLHNALSQIQSKAAAFGLMNQAILYPVEFVKHSAVLRVVYSDSFVGYFDSDLSLGSVLQSIVDQVRYGLGNRLTVHNPGAKGTGRTEPIFTH